MKKPVKIAVLVAALVIPFGGIAVAQDAPEDHLEACELLGPQDRVIPNEAYDPDAPEMIDNPDFDPIEFIDDVNGQDGEVDDPDTAADEVTSDPNPAFDPAETIPNPAFDLPEMIDNPEFSDALDPSGNGIACGIEDIAIWDELIPDPVTETPAPTTVTETPAPTTVTETPAPTTEHRTEVHQEQTVVVVPRDVEQRTPLQSVPSGPVDRP